MKDTYTPMEIYGKIVVVVNAPEKTCWPWIDKIATCTKYPTLEQDAPYWQERIGQRVEEKDFYIVTDYSTGREEAIPAQSVDFNWPESTAIPPQQKQDDGDLWDDAERYCIAKYCLDYESEMSVRMTFEYLKNYQLIKRK